MKNLHEKIYNSVVIYEKKCIKNISVVDEEVFNLLEKYKNKLTESDLDELQKDIFSVCLSAENAGFKTGIEFMFGLMNSKED